MPSAEQRDRVAVGCRFTEAGSWAAYCDAWLLTPRLLTATAHAGAEVYVWGRGEYGRLGLGDRTGSSKLRPQKARGAASGCRGAGPRGRLIAALQGTWRQEAGSPPLLVPSHPRHPLHPSLVPFQAGQGAGWAPRGGGLLRRHPHHRGHRRGQPTRGATGLRVVARGALEVAGQLRARQAAPTNSPQADPCCCSRSSPLLLRTPTLTHPPHRAAASFGAALPLGAWAPAPAKTASLLWRSSCRAGRSAGA